MHEAIDARAAGDYKRMMATGVVCMKLKSVPDDRLGGRWEEHRPIGCLILPVQNFEMTIELNYGWTVRPGLLPQLDLQYVVHPNGNTRRHNAAAIGINIILNL